MSIICYTGLPGSGKSYSVVENVVIPALKEGRVVAHNLTLNETALAIVCETMKPAQLVQIDRECTPAEVMAACPPGAVIVLDEVWRYWPAGIKANEVPKAELQFFKEHRHRVGEDGKSTEIVIVDQDPKTGVPAFLRALIEATYVHVKLSNVGAKGSFRVEVYARCQGAEKPSKGALIRKLVGKYKPEVWNCYVSHTQAQRLGEAGLEVAADKRASLLKGWTVKAAILAALGMPFLLWWASSAFMGMGGEMSAKHRDSAAASRKATAERSELASAPAVASSAPPGSVSGAAGGTSGQQPPDARPQAPEWTVVGTIQRADGTGYAVLKSTLGERRVELTEHCHLDPLNWVCDVDGQVAASWTGARWRTDFRVDPL